MEYEEKISDIFSPSAAVPFMEALTGRLNVEWVNIFYRWDLIYPDLDDNKFVDCAVASNADYLVTNDKDYRPLKNLPFPKLSILKIEDFIEVLNSL